MKKLLSLLAGLSMIVSSTTVLVACTTEKKWDEIEVDPPMFDVSVTGFEGTELKNIKIEINQDINKLKTDILAALAGTAWEEESATEWSYTKNDIELTNEELETIDWTRNAKYQVIVKSLLDDKPGLAIYTFQVENSMHIADNLRTTALGYIDDAREKTILIALIFQNMNLIPYINEISDQYIETGGNGTIQIHEKDGVAYGATISSVDGENEGKGTFKGSVDVTFTVEPKSPPEAPEDIAELTRYKDIGAVQDTRKYSILMNYIIANFNSKLEKLSELVNDLEVEVHEDNTATLTAVNDSKYFTGSVTVNFEIHVPD